MEKYIRDQIIEILSTVEDGIQHIQNTTTQNYLIEDCVIALRSVQDACKNELSKERYAYYTQFLDGILNSLLVAKERTIPINEVIELRRLIAELLEFTVKALKAEPEVKKEIVFLPYKASMWDSLESIWLAAKDDKTCDAYVMPIPYYDLGPNKEEIAMHYEGDKFPEYVPITNYKKFDIAKRKPDIIYIHNPYDGCNRVTSVHSDYYSAELKKYTDMLVYVPYFVTGGLFPESHAILPCYQYMDKMIVQNDTMQLQTKQQGGAFLHQYVPQEKMVPFGSPKIDRIVYCEEHKQIPAAWKNEIGDKKVILYNVSLSGLLQFGKQALRKMQYIFQCFSENRNVVLVWRPHPLIEATLKSMRPDLYEIYKALEKQFLEQKIGILDTTPDIAMAVAIADAYLGEESSSVVHLFGAAGKPIFVTDMTITKTPDAEEKASVLFGEFCVENENLWFMTDTFQTLCKMHLPSSEITPLLKFDDIRQNGRLYGKPLKIGNKIILPPLDSKEICEYNLDTQAVKMTPIENPVVSGNFGWAVHYQHYVYMIPWRYPAILRYDLRTRKCTYYTECLQELLKYQTPEHKEFLGHICVRENKILATVAVTNRILEFDMVDGSYRYHTLGPEDAKYVHIIDDGEAYWLIPWTTKAIVKWQYETGKISVYVDYPADFNCDKNWNNGEPYMFSGGTYSQEAIWLFPCYANMILRIDVHTGKIEQVKLPLPYEIYARKSEFYMQQNNYFGVNDFGDRYVIALSSYDRSMLVIDAKTQKSWLIPCRLSDTEVERLSGTVQASFGRIGEDAVYASKESPYRSIKDFLDFVVSGQHDWEAEKKSYAKFIKNLDGTCGEKVHQYIMKQISKELPL